MFRFLVSFLILFPIALNAQEKSSLLWKISGNDLEQPSYLFGTIHAIPKKDFYFTDVMKESFNTCNHLVLEVDLNTLTLEDKMNMAKAMFLEEGQTLQSIMDGQEYLDFCTYITDTLGIKEKKLERYNKIKPAYLVAFILNDYLGKLTGYETEFVKYAKKNKMTTEGLETLDFQLSLMESIPIEDQADLFLDMSSFVEYHILLDFYFSQEIFSIHNYTVENYTSEVELAFLEYFLYKRNIDWAEVIPGIIKEKSSFIAVGSLHLPGEKGLIEMLREKGYTVEPVYE